MRFDIPTLVGSILLAITSPATAQTQGSATTGTFPSLTGTWRSKSGAVLTGPGFYDPVNEKFIEPALTGISYSFTDDGWYEEAYYRAVSNPTTPSCPSGVMQWQHGRYTVNSTGSIFLTPITVDGRQQTSDPCSYKNSEYIRYKQAETFERYEVVVDTFHNIKRLNLYQYNGAPLMPLYIAFQPPQMLPTMTLNPTSSSTGAAATASASTASTVKARKAKREAIEKRWIGKKMLQHTSNADAAWFWYAGLGFSSLGLAMYLYNG